MVETRVEKYRGYREEIQNSFSDSDVTTSQKTSEKVSEILKSQNNNSISVDEMINVHEIYEKDNVNEINPLLERNRKRKIYYFVIISLIVILAALTAVFGILAFGGR